MKRVITIVSLLLSTILVFSQDSLWQKMKIDENLTISFPGKVEELDTTMLKEGKKWRIKVYKYEGDLSTFGLIVTPGETDINVDNRDSWKEALKGMSKGAMKSYLDKGITCSPGDTTIDDRNGIRIKSFFRWIENWLFYRWLD